MTITGDATTTAIAGEVDVHGLLGGHTVPVVHQDRLVDFDGPVPVLHAEQERRQMRISHGPETRLV